MKTQFEIFKSNRGEMVPSVKRFRDKTKYNRKSKYKLKFV